MATRMGARLLRPCVNRPIYDPQYSAVGELGHSNSWAIRLSNIFSYSSSSSNVFNNQSAPHPRREPLPGPATATSTFCYVSEHPDYRRRCYRSHHRLGPSRSRLPCHSPCLTLGFFHRGATPNISNCRRVVGIPSRCLRSAH